MGRLVVPTQRVVLTGSKGLAKPVESPDNYFARVAKYIPGEVVAIYIGAAGILKTVGKDDASLVLTVYWVFFVVCLFLTPIYLARFAKNMESKWKHLIVSTIAFIVWAYALGGLPELMGWYRPWIGSIAILAFSGISGAIEP